MNRFAGQPRAAFAPPAFALLDTVAAMREADDENLFQTAHRVLVNEALSRVNGRQREAARLLGVSSRFINYYAHKLKLRPKDQPVEITKCPPRAAHGVYP